MPVARSLQDHAAVQDTSPADDPTRPYASVVFALVIVFAALFIFWYGRFGWFRGDEWAFLTSRDGGSINGLFAAHNGHWSTIPVIEWRVLFNVFGLTSYRPYLLVILTTHLVAAVLLWVTMRRAAVNPWIATAAASAFALFGAGQKDIVWAFQVGFTGSVVFGLLHLMLADHDGPPDRRDWLGLAAGALGLMCSGVALAFVAAVGVATLLRRGWRVAVLHTLPLFTLYAIWAAKYANPLERKRPGLAVVLHWAWTGWWAGMKQLTQHAALALVFTLALLGGLIIGISVDAVRRDWRVRAAVPIGLLVGSVVFELSAASGPVATALLRQGFGVASARDSHYIYLVALMVLPFLAVVADAVARRWPLTLPVVVVLLLIGIPGNLSVFEAQARSSDTRRLVLSIPRVPLAYVVDANTAPDVSRNRALTVRWILDQYTRGKLPHVRLDPVNTATVALYLSLAQRTTTPDQAGKARCRTVDGRSFTLLPGDTVRVDAPTSVWLGMSDGRFSRPKYFNPLAGQIAAAVQGPLHLAARPGMSTSRQPAPALDPVPLTVCSVVDPGRLLVVPQSSAVFEGDDGWTTAKIPVSLSRASSRPVQVDWNTLATSSGATAGSDYVPAHGTLTFAPGQTNADASVNVRGDRRVEPNEQLVVRFTNARGAGIGSFLGLARLVIVNDD